MKKNILFLLSACLLLSTPRVGLSADQPARTGYAYDTRVKVNGNAGHEYGADLNPRQKSALLEYLKTL